MPEWARAGLSLSRCIAQMERSARERGDRDDRTGVGEVICGRPAHSHDHRVRGPTRYPTSVAPFRGHLHNVCGGSTNHDTSLARQVLWTSPGSVDTVSCPGDIHNPGPV